MQTELWRFRVFMARDRYKKSDRILAQRDDIKGVKGSRISITVGGEIPPVPA
jgi:hypothetical protein